MNPQPVNFNLFRKLIYLILLSCLPGRGATNCTLRKPCTEQDYYDIRTACDSDHKVQMLMESVPSLKSFCFLTGSGIKLIE